MRQLLLIFSLITVLFLSCEKSGGGQGQPVVIGDSRDLIKPAVCRTKVVAHRGGSAEAGSINNPDNSLAALRYAMGLGCYASECDIYITADDNVVVAHANDEYKINGCIPWESTLAQIRAGGKLTNGEDIPCLEDFLRVVVDASNCTKLWLDIKATTSVDTRYAIAAAQRACEIIKDFDSAKNFCEFICTGNGPTMASAFQYARGVGVPIGWMGAHDATYYKSKYYDWCNMPISYLEQAGGPYTIAEFVNAGIELSVFNADTDAEMEWYVARAADMKAICTNYPKKLIDKFKSAGNPG